MATAQRQTDSLSIYLKGLGGHRTLTREEEYELSARVKKGDARARDELARANLPFVVSVARKYAGRSRARLDDLVQEGNVGLMKAIEHFDAKKNVRFATYAVWWIRAYITRYLKDNRSQVRGGEGERGVMSDISLEMPINEDTDEALIDMLEDGAPTPDAALVQKRRDEHVGEALGKVKKRLGDLGWDIVKERLEQDSPQTLEELGARWGISRERVRQVELRTKSFLARYLAPLNEDVEGNQLANAA